MAVRARRLHLTAVSLPQHVAFPLFTGMGITLISAVIAGIVSRISQPELPFWYSASLPAATLAQREWILLIPALNLLLEIQMIFILLLLSKLDSVVLRLFAWTTVFSQSLLLMALLRIVYITS